MFTCSAASEADHEPILGTAPTDSRWLFVEEPGPWGAKPLVDNRLPGVVASYLQGLEGMAVHLVRHHGRTEIHAPVVMAATVDVQPGQAVRTRMHLLTLGRIEELPDIDLERLFEGTHPDAVEVTEPVWLVCTNGKRDRCCSVIGRPVADVLAARWPTGTWECTHLGGHRLAGTLLALPSAVTLGRLDAQNALDAADAVLAGTPPIDAEGDSLVRGRVGMTGAEQVLDQHLLTGGSPDVTVVSEPGPLRRQSCGADEESVPLKKTTTYRLIPND